jgi:antitoxin CcdA
MNRIPPTDRKHSKRPTNVSLDADLVRQARALSINISRACEQGLEMRIREARARQWREDNREAIDASNAFVDADGLPLSRFRQF